MAVDLGKSLIVIIIPLKYQFLHDCHNAGVSKLPLKFSRIDI